MIASNGYCLGPLRPLCACESELVRRAFRVALPGVVITRAKVERGGGHVRRFINLGEKPGSVLYRILGRYIASGKDSLALLKSLRRDALAPSAEPVGPLGASESRLGGPSRSGHDPGVTVAESRSPMY
jgi:hypothetical protein